MTAFDDAVKFLDEDIHYEPQWTAFAAVIDWDELEAISPGLAFAVLELAANSANGGHDAVKDLQQLVDVPADGIVGAATLAAIKKHDPVRLVRAIYEDLAGSSPGSFDTSLNHALALAGEQPVPTKDAAMTDLTPPKAAPPVAAPAAPLPAGPAWLTLVYAFLDANSFMAPVVAWLPGVPAAAKPIIAQIPQANAALKAQIAQLVAGLPAGAPTPTVTDILARIEAMAADIDALKAKV